MRDERGGTMEGFNHVENESEQTFEELKIPQIISNYI
jgi:hypothetical protein